MTNQRDLERFLKEERQLASAIADFEHQIRRMRDQLERSGGRALMIEAALKQVEENLGRTRRDIDRVRMLIQSRKPLSG